MRLQIRRRKKWGPKSGRAVEEGIAFCWPNIYLVLVPKVRLKSKIIRECWHKRFAARCLENDE